MKEKLSKEKYYYVCFDPTNAGHVIDAHSVTVYLFVRSVFVSAG
jgi:hypothetical protein